ncbi:hypothetical protein GGI25_002518 [Coemansia spiralis]|uniref:Tr-type G domain-containing protein n=2 Tax=Coemansia TaxID=4863 RepID=A0A9W8KYX4_9FUNG|nr:hypothetical protein EDC05_002479 [Coemansia umbellata]KAJ2622918.1 hypothetical protein GGI26_002884 [Coemansia sp. RSA 1358]KAJ2678167.1 hypothetical protein GGI25_002518 [Coemansia spiralis]
MAEKLGYRISNLDITDNPTKTQKYAVDTTLFDSLVDKAATTVVTEQSQRLTDPEWAAQWIASRLDEDNGETILEIDANGLSDTDVDKIAATLKQSVQGAFVQLLDTSKLASVAHARELDTKVPTKQKNKIYYLARRTPPSIESMLEVRVAVAGNVDAGKSTMLGVLTQGHLDDGRGRMRLALFRHKHEIDTGRTSSIGMEILGFDNRGQAVRHTDTHRSMRKLDWHTVCTQSSKLVAFLDLAGHEKYLKTTMFGMAGGAPDYIMLMVAANAGLTGMAKEHLGLALALNVPVFVVITKIDMCPPMVLDATLKQLTKVLRSSGCRKLPLIVNDRAAVVMAAQRFTNRVCPVFQVSNVTGENVDNLLMFLNILPIAHRPKAIGPLRFDINEIFSVPFAGTVVSGVVTRGEVRVNDLVWVGPDFHGNFQQTTIKGIQRKRVDVESAVAGQSVSMALKKIARSQVRKGMVVFDKGIEPVASRTFEAEVVILYHSTTITQRYQAMVHCGCVRQTARILSITRVETTAKHTVRGVDVEVHGAPMDERMLRTGDRALVVFQFIRHPECLAIDTRLIFREGRTKGVGKVVRILGKDEEAEAVRQATNGNMVFSRREEKAKVEALRHTKKKINP